MGKWFTHEDAVQFLFLNDLLLGPIFIFLLFRFCTLFISKKKNPIYQKYFLNALAVRIASAVVMALIFQYYYKGGDTLAYFTYTQRIRSILFDSPHDFFSLMTAPTDDYFLLDKVFGLGAQFYMDHSSNLLIRITVLLSYLLFNTYILISFTYTIFCFYGCWKIFTLFQELYPHLEKEFALACLYLPSVCFWGTGIMKDPISLGALGLITYHAYMLFFKKTKVLGRLLVIIFCFWLLKGIKFYILLAFLPAYVFWIIFRYKESVRNSLFKTLIGPAFFIFAVLGGGFILYKIAALSQRYSFESIIRTAKDTQNWLYYSSQLQGGSAYSLGDIDFSLSGIIQVIPKSINVALFRPYLWEAKKPILLPAAIEGIVSLFFTIRLLYKTGFIRFFKLVMTNAEAQFCLIFSLLFAFAVGFTSYNFGALVRYKIPMMPFYYIALFILTDKDNKLDVPKKKPIIKPKTVPQKLQQV